MTFPKSLQQALQTRFTAEEVDAFLTSPIRPSFFYGSLMLPSYVCAVAGRFDIESVSKNMTPAVLPGHERYAIRWADYPAVLSTKRAQDTVSGLLLFGLSQRERSFINAYEGACYDSEQVQVEIRLADGTPRRVEAVAYIWRGSLDDLVGVEEKIWTIEGFLKGRINSDFISIGDGEDWSP